MSRHDSGTTTTEEPPIETHPRSSGDTGEFVKLETPGSTFEPRPSLEKDRVTSILEALHIGTKSYHLIMGNHTSTSIKSQAIMPYASSLPFVVL